MHKKGWKEFLDLCSNIDNSHDLKKLFDLFFTIEEKETFAARYMIIHALLNEQLTQREIAEKYNVSIAQITRGSNALKIIDQKLKNHLMNRKND